MKRILAFVLFLCVPVATFAADPFKNIVKAIEQEYGVRHTGVPWFARAIMKPVLWGSGVNGLKLAEFENVRFTVEGSQERLAQVIERTVGPEWQQIVRVRSRHDGETTYVYVRPVGTKFTMLVVNIESNEANVVQMDVRPGQLEKWMSDKDEMAWTRHGRHPVPDDPDRSGDVPLSSRVQYGNGIELP